MTPLTSQIREIFNNNMIGKHDFTSVTYTGSDIDNIISQAVALFEKEIADRLHNLERIYETSKKMDTEKIEALELQLAKAKESLSKIGDLIEGWQGEANREDLMILDWVKLALKELNND